MKSTEHTVRFVVDTATWERVQHALAARFDHDRVDESAATLCRRLLLLHADLVIEGDPLGLCRVVDDQTERGRPTE